ncbi:hypothetical protein [Phytoactinopolyspora limicola]|uniref:hypothetical protein n=1 Tax=Phytoactinopolyspora limicola TaxID=2715536 RepID=UPI00140A04A2|nr:hypothetical protein [Phytoactinopolyspora limicola]
MRGRRLLMHQFTVLAAIGPWVTRRPRAAETDVVFGYARAQAPMIYALLFVVMVEGTALALLVPWPVVHTILVVVHTYAALLLLGSAAATHIRPHVIGRDDVRVRYGVGFELRIPLATIANAKARTRSSDAASIHLADGHLDVVVSGQTNVVIDLTDPIRVEQPLDGTASQVEIYADEPREFVRVLNQARAKDSSSAADLSVPAGSVPDHDGSTGTRRSSR